MSEKNSRLCDALQQRFGDRGIVVVNTYQEVTLELPNEHLLEVAVRLRDDEGFDFKQLIDLCGVDYSSYGEGQWQGQRYAVVIHLMSLTHNHRLRVKVFLDDEYPMTQSLIDVWPASNWFEREAFDLYGIVFDGHPDLRRILTDYGFIGHPFRKDFPLSGHVEMRYDEEKRRVVYEPVSIEPRITVPKVIRDDHRYATTDQAAGEGK